MEFHFKEEQSTELLKFMESGHLKIHNISFIWIVGGRKTAQEKKQIPGNGGSQELFGPMFPWFCLFSLSFQWEEGQKFPGTLFLGTFFFLF